MSITPDDIKLEMTCGACPEQYEANYKGSEVGYLRLRHGYFYASVPNVGGADVYEAWPKGDGVFYDQEERDHHLNNAKEAIADWLNGIAEKSVESGAHAAADGPALDFSEASPTRTSNTSEIGK